MAFIEYVKHLSNEFEDHFETDQMNKTVYTNASEGAAPSCKVTKVKKTAS